MIPKRRRSADSIFREKDAADSRIRHISRFKGKRGALSTVAGLLPVFELLVWIPFVLIGPFVWMYKLFAAGQIAIFLWILAAWVVSVVIVIAEFRRVGFAHFTFGIGLVWSVALIAAFCF